MPNQVCLCSDNPELCVSRWNSDDTNLYILRYEKYFSGLMGILSTTYTECPRVSSGSQETLPSIVFNNNLGKVAKLPGQRKGFSTYNSHKGEKKHNIPEMKRNSMLSHCYLILDLFQDSINTIEIF